MTEYLSGTNFHGEMDLFTQPSINKGANFLFDNFRKIM